jgi:16S rRNA G966 N2-methylase RsmD
VIAGSAVRHLGEIEANIVFVDPPYAEEREYSAALRALGEKPPGLAVLQHSIRYAAAERSGALVRGRVVRQGDNALSFYRPEP